MLCYKNHSQFCIIVKNRWRAGSCWCPPPIHSLNTMPKKISDLAAEKVPSLPDRISLFRSKLQIAHYALVSITDYCHALYKSVAHLGKRPDDFTQADVDGYLHSMLSRHPQPAESQFKHFVYGLKYYRQAMGLSELNGLILSRSSPRTSV